MAARRLPDHVAKSFECDYKFTKSNKGQFCYSFRDCGMDDISTEHDDALDAPAMHDMVNANSVWQYVKQLVRPQDSVCLWFSDPNIVLFSSGELPHCYACKKKEQLQQCGTCKATHCARCTVSRHSKLGACDVFQSFVSLREKHLKGPVYRCNGCHKKRASKLCAKCFNVHYCSKECQLADHSQHAEKCEVWSKRPDAIKCALAAAKKRIAASTPAVMIVMPASVGLIMMHVSHCYVSDMEFKEVTHDILEDSFQTNTFTAASHTMQCELIVARDCMRYAVDLNLPDTIGLLVFRKLGYYHACSRLGDRCRACGAMSGSSCKQCSYNYCEACMKKHGASFLCHQNVIMRKKLVVAARFQIGVHICSKCYKEYGKLKCAGCLSARYCSAKCQKEDVDVHSPYCKEVNKRQIVKDKHLVRNAIIARNKKQKQSEVD